jgi:hypothetical protein
MVSSSDSTRKNKYIWAWLLCLIFYFVGSVAEFVGKREDYGCSRCEEKYKSESSGPLRGEMPQVRGIASVPAATRYESCWT